MTNQDKLKAELLVHYSQREPVEYKQYDAFTDPGHFDDYARPSEDGVAYSSHKTKKLMHGSNVRVLIRHDTSDAEALKALEGILFWLKSIPYCERCGGKCGHHHGACHVESLTSEQVQAVMESMKPKGKKSFEEPFDEPPF